MEDPREGVSTTSDMSSSESSTEGEVGGEKMGDVSYVRGSARVGVENGELMSVSVSVSVSMSVSVSVSVLVSSSESESDDSDEPKSEARMLIDNLDGG